MKSHKLFVIIFFIVSSLSCDADKCFDNKGDKLSKTFRYESYKTLHVYGIFDIELVQDTTYYIEVEAYEPVLEGVELELFKDSLSLYNYNNCFWRRSFERPLARVHFSDIDNLNIFEASNVYSNDSITDDFAYTVRSSIAESDIVFNNRKVFFYINKNCGGNYKFRGKTNHAFLMNFNTGLFDMSELECKTAHVRNYSVIDVKIKVLNNLKVGIYNSGNVLYIGQPNIEIDTLASSGKPIPIN